MAIIGGHIYGGGLSNYPLAKQKGKEVWMTEHYNDGTDWASCMQTAKEIHDSMTVAEFNAYVYWWLKDYKGDAGYMGPINSNGMLTMRGYVLGQWAKYVRPGAVRVDATYNPSQNVYTSAYKSGNKVGIIFYKNLFLHHFN